MKEALKLALRALHWSKPHEDAVITHGEAITAIKEALAQPVQEPVGKFAKFTDNIWREVTAGSAGVPLYTTPSPCPTCEALARTVMLDQTSHDTQRKRVTESMIKAGLAALEAIRQTELVGDYELIKRLLEAAHDIGDNT